MRYFDYDWDLGPNGIIFDPEINFDKLGWKAGDMFEIKNINGRAMMVKLDPLVAWVKAGGKELENNR
jgi:hypothetical protein